MRYPYWTCEVLLVAAQLHNLKKRLRVEEGTDWC